MSTPLFVLSVEDSASDARFIQFELGKLGRPIEMERIEDAASMRLALMRRKWDIVISDWSMPNFTAPDALQVLREMNLDLPFVIVSGTVGEEAAVEAMRAGAHDYIRKNRLGRLNAVVERELRESEVRAARLRAEAALQKSERRFARLADSGIVGVVFADTLGQIFDANDAYLQMMGYSRQDLLEGMRWDDRTPPEWRQTDEAAVEQIKTAGVAAPWEKEMLRKDGTRVPVLIGVAILDAPECIVFVADLTKQKNAEEGRARLASEAEIQGAGRRQAEEALRQSEEQLRHAQKMEAVGRLAGGVAHDFNNLLSVILGYGELGLMGLKEADPLHNGMDQICRAAKRAAALTRQLLLFSRQEVTEPKVVDLNDVLANMQKMLQRILGEDVDLAIVGAAELGRVWVDPGHIEQVIMNLAVNARDAMPTGGILTIETANVSLDAEYAITHLPTKTGPYVMLAVTDTGFGMDKATQAKIFDPFFTTKEKGKGTGLGLSIVFGIVQQSGGNIWVYSEPGRGTTFKLYLPLVTAEVNFDRPQPTPSTLRGTETILLVEDELQVRAVIVSILRKHGYNVIAAQSPAEALFLCETDHAEIHMLLTDVVMPKMSGPELARRAAAAKPDMKVLFMSGCTDDSIVRNGVLETSMAFLQKPITPGSLARKIREVLDGPHVPFGQTSEERF